MMNVYISLLVDGSVYVIGSTDSLFVSCLTHDECIYHWMVLFMSLAALAV